MEEYKSNSFRSREENKNDISEKKNLEKIVTGHARSRKKSGFEKISEIFIPEDVDDVKTYVITDVIKPAVSDIIVDTVKAFLGVDTRNNSRVGSKVSYRDYYSRGRDKSDYRDRDKRNYPFADIILDTRGEAEAVLDQMDEILDQYDNISVGDLYDLVGMDTKPVDFKYGWTSIRNASVTRVREGYLLKLPKAMPL